MKSFLLFCVPAAGLLAGCAYYPDPYGYPAQGYYGAPAGAYGGYGYGAPTVDIGVYGTVPDGGRRHEDGRRGDRHWRGDRDRDRDGVPDRYDARPGDPRRR